MYKVKDISRLTPPELANVEADSIAANARNFFPSSRTKIHQYELSNCGLYIVVDGKATWSGETSLLRWRRSEFKLQIYYTTTFHLSLSSLHSINWAGLQIARQTLSPGTLQFSLKYGIDWLPTGNHMSRVEK